MILFNMPWKIFFFHLCFHYDVAATIFCVYVLPPVVSAHFLQTHYLVDLIFSLVGGCLVSSQFVSLCLSMFHTFYLLPWLLSPLLLLLAGGWCWWSVLFWRCRVCMCKWCCHVKKKLKSEMKISTAPYCKRLSLHYTVNCISGLSLPGAQCSRGHLTSANGKRIKPQRHCQSTGQNESSQFESVAVMCIKCLGWLPVWSNTGEKKAWLLWQVSPR